MKVLLQRHNVTNVSFTFGKVAAFSKSIVIPYLEKHMELKQLFKASAIATALVLAGCGGDINISEGDIDNSVTNNNGGSTGGNTGGDTGSDDATPGEVSSFLSGEVSDAFGQTVEVRVLSGRITADDAGAQGVVTLTNDKVWALEGPVFIGNDKADSVTLAIEEGTVIFGRTGADYLVVSRDSKIEAEGTASAPIIMTSFNDVVGDEVGAGQWGGVVFLVTVRQPSVHKMVQIVRFR